MTEYWSWWQGGLALGGLTVLFRLLLHRPLGVSGSWLKIASSRQEWLADHQAQQFANDQAAVSHALLQATLAQFGEQALAGRQPGSDSNKQADPKNSGASPASVGQHAVFLVCIFIGGLLAALYTGRFSVDLELSQLLTSLSHGVAQSWLYLLFGGMMVGFGTQMAAGCTSGHGLSGCAQLSVASLAATGIFFSCAVFTAMFFSLAL